MKAREFESLIRRNLLAQLPGFDCKGNLLFIRPVHYLLRGFCFSGSIDPRGFYLYSFVQPLYVPFPHICFNFGLRLSGRTGEGWHIPLDQTQTIMAEVLSAIQSQGMRLVLNVETPKDLAEKGRYLVGDEPGAVSVPVEEAEAYSWILANNHPAAIAKLDRVDAVLSRPDIIRTEAYDEMQARNRWLRDRLIHQPEEAHRRLEEWTEATRAALRLPKDEP